MVRRTSTLTRRTVIGGTLAGALAPSSIVRRASAQEKTVYIQSYGGLATQAEESAYYKPFTAETGIEVRPVTPWSYAKLKAEVQSGNYEFDLSTMNPGEIFQAREEGLLEPVDWSILSRDALPSHMILHDMAVGTHVIGTPLCYRKDKFPNGGPKSWADFWDVKKFPGPRAMYDRSFSALAFALLADGVPRDKLFPMDFDRAFKKLDELKPHIKVWYTQGSQQQQLIKDGEVDMQPMWNARAQELIDQGVPIEIVWNGAEHQPTFWYVAKGTPRAKLAWQYIASNAKPQRLAAICTLTMYGPQNPRAFDFIAPERARVMPTWPEHLRVSFQPDFEWLGPRLNALKERWTQWLAT